jgi:hypothetical protein
VVIEGCGDLLRTVVSAAGAVAVSFAPRLGSDWRKVDAAEWSSGRVVKWSKRPAGP